MLGVVLTALAIALHAPHAFAQAKDQNKATKGKPVATGPKHRYQCKVGPYEKQTRLVIG